MSVGRFLLSATLVALAADALPAADLLGGYVDMRLGGGITGSNDEVRVSDNDGAQRFNSRESESWDESYRATLNWVGSTGLSTYGGWIWGVGGSYTTHGGAQIEYDSYTTGGGPRTTGKTKLYAWAVDGSIGYAVPFGEHFQLELLPFVGPGKAYLDIPEGNDHLTGSAGSYWEAGFNVNAVYTFDDGFQLGASAGYLHYDTTVRNHTYDGPGALEQPQKFRFTVDTYQAAIFIGVRL